jgi:hypothetical protein
MRATRQLFNNPSAINSTQLKEDSAPQKAFNVTEYSLQIFVSAIQVIARLEWSVNFSQVVVQGSIGTRTYVTGLPSLS